MPDIQLLDGKKINFKNQISGFEVVKKISKSLEKNALIMEVDGQLKDLSYEIKKNAKVKIITAKDKEGLDTIRHDAAHNGNGSARIVSRHTSNDRSSY